MRFGMVDRHGVPTLALPTDRGITLVTEVCERSGIHAAHGLDAPPRTVLDLLAGDGLSLAFAEAVAAAADDFEPEGPWRMPFRPGKIVAVGRNYRAHAEELGNRPPAEPILFGKEPSICIGPDEPIAIDPAMGRVDHEGELAVVMGRAARNIAPEAVRACVAGYTLLNDVTARDVQAAAKKKGLPWFLAKNQDTFCPLGPVVVPADAVAWPPALDLSVRVNGEVRQTGNTGDMIFQLPELIAYITRHLPLAPGDVIATGTPEGVSPIRPGDVVEVVCPEIGALRNPVT